MNDNYLRNAGRLDWPENENRIDVIGQNGNDGQHYMVGMTLYKINPNGFYALYCKDEQKDIWRESAHVTNTMLKGDTGQTT